MVKGQHHAFDDSGRALLKKYLHGILIRQFHQGQKMRGDGWGIESGQIIRFKAAEEHPDDGRINAGGVRADVMGVPGCQIHVMSRFLRFQFRHI